jgi:hypothetical protein
MRKIVDIAAFERIIADFRDARRNLNRLKPIATYECPHADFLDAIGNHHARYAIVRAVFQHAVFDYQNFIFHLVYISLPRFFALRLAFVFQFPSPKAQW